MNIPIKDAEERIAELEDMVKDRDALRHRVEGYISSETAHIREINALKAENERLREALIDVMQFTTLLMDDASRLDEVPAFIAATKALRGETGG